ncbi:primase-helicase family protein [Methylobacterium sp. JK268]
MNKNVVHVLPTGKVKSADGEPRPLGFDIDRMNREYALILIGSTSLVLHQDPDAPVEHRVRILTISAFQDWFSNRFTEIRTADGEVKMVTWAVAWLRSPHRRQYAGIEFHPNPDGVPGNRGYFNTWQGFGRTPAPKPNAYAVFRDHLLTNVCGGDPALFAWVFGFFAHIFQRPRERIGVSLVFRGKMGSGKTKVGEVIGSLLGAHFLLIDDPRYLVGQFNAHMTSLLLLQADEAVWAGDVKAAGRLKSLVTSSVQMIEAKRVDPIPMKNFVRLIMTSNEDWVVPAGKEERRFCVVDVGDRCMQNSTYFAEMDAELDAGGREALLHDLLTFDLSSVELRHIPKTGALLEQKIHSLDPIDGWWLDRLTSGCLLDDDGEWLPEVGCTALYRSYVAAADRIGVKRKSDPNAFGVRLHKLVPGLAKKRPRAVPARWSEDDGAKRPWLYVMPPLSECREAFETSVGQVVAWPEEDGFG